MFDHHQPAPKTDRFLLRAAQVAGIIAACCAILIVLKTYNIL